ncbi:hypothetical protein B296_00011821 [Ensete ventricosum]|uniref:Uncharacterized protein n=1 Tax=Ensete ventricosum TaxID=4639 RepID=A0A427AF02_ENSVE|nr:hypothetical protein B296_00011821 [Ensete ventricosum]
MISKSITPNLFARSSPTIARSPSRRRQHHPHPLHAVLTVAHAVTSTTLTSDDCERRRRCYPWPALKSSCYFPVAYIPSKRSRRPNPLEEIDYRPFHLLSIGIRAAFLSTFRCYHLLPASSSSPSLFISVLPCNLTIIVIASISYCNNHKKKDKKEKEKKSTLLFPFSPTAASVATTFIPTTTHNSVSLLPHSQRSPDPRHNTFLPLPAAFYRHGSLTLSPAAMLPPSSSSASSPRPVAAVNRRPPCCLPHLPHASRRYLCCQSLSLPLPLPLSRPTRATLLLWLLAASRAIASDYPSAAATNRRPYLLALVTSHHCHPSLAVASSSKPLLPQPSPFPQPSRCHLLSQPQPPPSAESHLASSAVANRRNLLLDRTLLYHRGTLAPSSSPVAIVAPKRRRDCCPSCHCHCHWPPLFLPSTPHDVVASSLIAATLTAEVLSNLALVAAPPCCHCCTSLLPLLPPLSPTSFSIYW